MEGKESAVLNGHTAAVFGVRFSPDSSLLASCGYDQKLVVWDVKAGKQKHVLATVRESVEALAFIPDGSAIIYSLNQTGVERWDPAKEETRTILKHKATRVNLAMFPDGKSIALAGSNTPVRTYDLETGQCHVTLSTKSPKPRATTVTPDGRFLLVGCGDTNLGKPSPGHVELWRANGKYVTRFKAHDAAALSLALTDGGRTLATGDSRGAVKVWDISSILKMADKEKRVDPD